MVRYTFHQVRVTPWQEASFLQSAEREEEEHTQKANKRSYLKETRHCLLMRTQTVIQSLPMHVN